MRGRVGLGNELADEGQQRRSDDRGAEPGAREPPARELLGDDDPGRAHERLGEAGLEERAREEPSGEERGGEPLEPARPHGPGNRQPDRERREQEQRPEQLVGPGEIGGERLGLEHEREQRVRPAEVAERHAQLRSAAEQGDRSDERARRSGASRSVATATGAANAATASSGWNQESSTYANERGSPVSTTSAASVSAEARPARSENRATASRSARKQAAARSAPAESGRKRKARGLSSRPAASAIPNATGRARLPFGSSQSRSSAARNGSWTWWSALPSAPLATAAGVSARTATSAIAPGGPSRRHPRAAIASSQSSDQAGPTNAAAFSACSTPETEIAAATESVCTRGQMIRARSGKFTSGSRSTKCGKAASCRRAKRM